MARLGAGAMPAGTVKLVVDVLDLDDLPHAAPRRGFAQTNSSCADTLCMAADAV